MTGFDTLDNRTGVGKLSGCRRKASPRYFISIWQEDIPHYLTRALEHLNPGLCLAFWLDGSMLVQENTAMNAKWCVLAIYENEVARECAMQYCDGLVQRFWKETSFEIGWSDWKSLERPEPAKEACQKACAAHILLVATARRGTIPPKVSNWLQWALQGRAEKEGILVGLPAPGAELTAECAATHRFLRKLAHQSGLDYLTAIPQSLDTRVPVSAESCHRRATQQTNVLNAILRRTRPPHPL
jgi:hypothetical protein